MIKVFIEAEAGAYEKGRYNEKTLEYMGKAGQISECEPMGLLEQREDNEIGKILPKQEALEYIRKYRNE